MTSELKSFKFSGSRVGLGGTVKIKFLWLYKDYIGTRDSKNLK